jgi:hypothetical protein
MGGGKRKGKRKRTNLGSVVGGTKDQFRSSVVSGADIGDVGLIFYQYLGTTKVTELQNAGARIQQQVLGLDIAVADSLRVNVGQGTEELVDVELYFEYWHGRLYLVEISRSAVDCLGHIFLHQVQVDFVLLRHH